MVETRRGAALIEILAPITVFILIVTPWILAN